MTGNGVERGYRALVELARLGSSELSPERIADRALQLALEGVGADSGELELIVDGHKQLVARRSAEHAASAPASRIEAPIVSAGRQVGVLCCAATRANAFDDLRRELLPAIGAQLGPLIGRSLTGASDLSQSLLELRALHRVSAATRSLDLDEVLNRSLEITLEAAHAVAGAIYLRDEAHRVYRRTARRDVPDDVAPLEYPMGPVDARFPEGIPYVLDMDDPSEDQPPIDAARRVGYRRILIIPLHVEGRPVGLLGLDYREPISLPASTLLTLEAIAGQEATAIEHARVHRVLARRAEVFGLLRAFGERALAPMDTHELALLIVQTAVQITRADRGLIGRINRRTSRVLAGVGTDAGLVGFEMPLDEPYMAQSLADPSPIVVEDVAALEPQSIIARMARERNTCSFMFITMRHRGRPIGQLFTGSGEPRRYEPVEVEGMQLLSSMAAEVIERSRAEEEVETERARLGATIEHLPVVVAVLGADGNLLHINAAARAFLVQLGHDPNNWRGGFESLEYSYPDGHPLPRAELPVMRAFAGERPEPLQMTIADERGRHWTVIGVAAPLTDEEGKVQAVVTGFQDVTSLRELADAKDRFLRVASHELRSPITSLRATTALLEMDPSSITDPARRATMLQRIQRQVDRLIRLVEQLIDSARLNATEVPLQPTECDLAQIAREAIELARSGATGPSEVRLQSPPTLPGRWDPLRLEQVLTNLIGNALRYSPPDQEVLVTLTEGDPVKIEVIDRGIGIPKEQIDKLFTPFFRASNAAQHHKGGLGLGLYIAADIVRRHGGQIEVGSELGRGSTFTIELPRRQP
ncbi:MAG TPA: ATP-binding protein [Polyangia bacterium]